MHHLGENGHHPPWIASCLAVSCRRSGSREIQNQSLAEPVGGVSPSFLCGPREPPEGSVRWKVGLVLASTKTKLTVPGSSWTELVSRGRNSPDLRHRSRAGDGYGALQKDRYYM